MSAAAGGVLAVVGRWRCRPGVEQSRHICTHSAQTHLFTSRLVISSSQLSSKVCAGLDRSLDARQTDHAAVNDKSFNRLKDCLITSVKSLYLDRPFCERSILCFAHVSFFFSQLTFSDVCKPIFSKLFHMTWLYSKRKRCYADFLKVPPNKNEGRKTPNFAKSRV